MHVVINVFHYTFSSNVIKIADIVSIAIGGNRETMVIAIRIQMEGLKVKPFHSTGLNIIHF